MTERDSIELPALPEPSYRRHEDLILLEDVWNADQVRAAQHAAIEALSASEGRERSDHLQQQAEPVGEITPQHRSRRSRGDNRSTQVCMYQSLPVGTKLYASAPPAQQAGEECLQFSLGEAKALVELFGGSNTCMVVQEMPERVFDGETHPAGKYAFCLDCPEEGSTYLGPHDPDTEEHDDKPSEQPAQGVPAETVSKALWRAFSLGQTYWQQADSDSYNQNRLADETRAKFNRLVEETLAASPAPAAVPEGMAKAIARMDECRAGCDAGEPFYADVRAWDTIRARLAAAPAPEVSRG